VASGPIVGGRRNGAERQNGVLAVRGNNAQPGEKSREKAETQKEKPSKKRGTGLNRRKKNSLSEGHQGHACRQKDEKGKGVRKEMEPNPGT